MDIVALHAPLLVPASELIGLEQALVVKVQPTCGSDPNSMALNLAAIGDIARHSFYGSLHYVVPKVSQIKLQGQRIEHAEVEYHFDDVDTGTLVANSGTIDALYMGRVQRMQSRQPPTASANIWVYESIRFAQDILAHEVKLEDPILVCLERSRWVPLAILAIWKAGLCLVLQDPTHPATRLRFIANESSTSMKIANEGTHFKASILCSTVLQINDDRLWTQNVNFSLAETVHVGGNSAAYIFFTSGSTRIPQGAVVEHASLSVSWETFATLLQPRPISRVLQFAYHA
ncbi:acetyl-CoA synthetase-like protein [Aspergillus vadensis CBS 113365]|uniref:Acetyl-CoA synthetase-like protein n=1 Tax=Aspergillus vadensis (strain CBS 113365 / IMI 142717 / IBT 24658) TaxID=1448311 RepID=A0A319BA26_ASPVC|nr:acetyl-CoA synthetase-like protein [Aspergillus vadensis CBS 113365]PYH63363.1 acetyl-CoA synthetase-like protein [Aspergillus vadensis CBS 113365]